MKNYLLFNQSFGTEGSPNQTGETLTRENRVGLMSYLRRILMLLFAVLVMSIANIGTAWGATITINSSTTTSDALFPVSAAPTQYEYSSNSSVAGWLLINMGTSSSITITNKTGATITAVTAEGVADNNKTKTVNFTISDGTTTAETSSGSWNSRQSETLTSKALNATNVGKLKCDAGQTYTITNKASSSYDAGVRFVITYTSTLPTSLTNGATTSSTQALSWTAPSTAPANGYLVAYSSSTSTAPANSVTSTTGAYTVVAIAAGTTNTTLSELGASTTYNWWVRSKNARGNSSWVAGSSFTTEAAPAGSGWGIASSDNSWMASADEMSGSGTVTKTLSLSANADLQFKIVEISPNTWYGNGEIWGGTKTQSVSSTGTANNCHLLTTEAGSYTFSFNTSTKDLTITYPNSYTFYYANTSSWSNVYVYKFTSNGSTGNNAAWPGTEIESPAYTCGGTDYYEATSDGYAKLIFTDNSGSQTGDMVVSSSNAGKYVGGTGSSWSNFPTYTISYAANSGSGSMSSQTGIACGTDKATTANAFTRDGYRFTGWKANVDVTVGGVSKTAGTLLADKVTIQDISSNITLTAQWEEAATCSGDPTALVSGTLYQVSDMASACLGEITGTGQYFYGLSSSGKFYINGTTNSNNASTGTVEIKTASNTIDKIEFTGIAWFKGAGTNTCRSIKFVVPSAGTLTIYGKTSSSKGNVVIKTESSGNTTVIANSVNAYASGSTTVSAGTYYVLSDGESAAIVGLKFVEESCSATQPGTIGKGTLSGCTLRLTAAGSPASNNTWYWQSSADGTDKSESGATKDVTSTGTYYIRSFCSTGSGCWSDARLVTVSASDLTPAAPSALAAASPTAKGVTLTVTDAANTNDYEFYVSTDDDEPGAGTSATHSVTSGKSVTITDKYAGTTFYAWARAKCGSNKSGWTALTGNTFTTSTVTMTPTLTNVKHTSGATSSIGGSDYTAVFTADDEYSMPDPTVTIGGNAATSGTDYTWSVDGSVGTITIPANKINGNIAITLNSADAAPSSAVISGTYHYFPGENISLTCTPTGNNGPTTYQWYKGGKSDEDNLIDGATSATYTKNSCAFEDAGSYYCKVTCNATSIWANTNSSENYDVKILRLYVNGSRNGDAYGNVDFVKVDGTTATASIALGAGWTYGFSVADGCGTPRGNSGTMTENNCTGWTMDITSGQCAITTTNAATYIFTVNYSNLSAPVVSVTYPVGNQAADKVIYFDNNDRAWTSVYYRIGHSSHSQASQLSLVSGTANLYKMTTTEYNGFSGWHIANATGDVGDGKSIYKTVDGTPITEATAHEGGAVTQEAITVTPTTSKGNGADKGVNDNCEFFNYTITSGMKTDNVAISDYSNGTITVAYTDVAGASQSFTSGSENLAHTVIITPTATPATGYDLGGLTVNAVAHTSGNTYTCSGATVVAATFTPHVYTITLNKGDHGADNQSATVAYLDDKLTSITHVTSTGYTLTGYYDGSTKVLNADGSFAGKDITGYIEDGVWTKTANATLTAKWEAKTTTLTFDANTTYHGTTGDGGATATYDATALASVTHTTPAAGYQLDGYYTTATGEGTKIVTASGTLVASTSYTTAGGAWHSELANLTLYARYTDKSYSVTHTFTNANRSSGGEAGASAATHGTDYSVVVAATSGYTLPSTITVTIGGETATAGTEYTWTKGTGTVTIGGSYITGNIVITVTGEEEGGGDCTPINASITFDNNKSAKFGVAWTESDITTSGGASYTLTNCSSDAAHDMTKPAIKGTKNTTLIQIDLPSGVTSGTISVDVATYNKGAATVAITNSEGEVLASTTSFSSTTVNGDATSWTAPTLTTLSYSSITAGGTYYIKETSGSSNVYIYAFSATGTKVCDDEPAGEEPIPALISYYLQTPSKSTTPASLSTDSIITTPARLKGDTLKNFVPVTLGSSLGITGPGKDEKNSKYTAKIGKAPADSTTTAANEIKLAFDVHDDYELNISSITLTGLTVGNDNTLTYRAKITDGTTQAVGRIATTGGGADRSVVFESFSGKKFSGTVTLSLWVWGVENCDYRLKSPIQIDGTLTRKVSACTMPTQTFTAGAYTLGDDALDLSTLFSSNSSGAVTYSVVSAGGTSATIVGSSFTASNTGTATIRATQAADGEGNYCAKSIETTITVSGDCTPQSLSKVVVTGGSAGTVTGYNGDEYAGSAVISVNGSTTDATNIDGESGNETGYKMTGSGTAIVFATLKKGTFLAGDQVRIGITRRNDTRQVDSKYNVLTIYYGTNKDDATALATINTSGDNDNGAAEREGAGFYTYTLTAANVTTIGSKKGIGLFRETDNGQNPYVHSVEIRGCRDWTVCTAPNAVVAGSVTHNSAVLTVTDEEETGNYEFYWNTTGTDPTASTVALATGSALTKTITGLSASTTYYYWVRSNCGGYKSAWVAGTLATFTTTAAPSTYSVTYSATDKTSGSVPEDASTYEEGDVVTVKGNTGSLANTGYSFVGWNTASDGTGTFYPAGYKFYMGDANVTLYAVWGSVGATCVTLTNFETSSYAKSSNKPDSEGKYFYGYKGTVGADYAVTITTPATDVKGANSGANLLLTQNTRFSIYADNTTTGGTPATFSDVTAVSFKIKANKNTRIPTIDVYVGSTKIKTVTGGSESSDTDGHEYDTSGFTTITVSGLSNLAGIVKFVNTSSGSSDYKAYFDDIQICYGSGASSGYTVSFDKNGHGSAIADIENVPSGSKIGAPVPAPTAADYDFLGWYREAGGTNAWNFGTMTITKDTTLYAKWGNCAPTITTHPVSANYNQNGVATALSVTAATNDGGTLEYQWYSNEEDSNEDGTEIPGATSASYTPNTSLIGTTYYYCMVSNDCGIATSAVAAITVRDEKEDPTAVWTIAEPTHGGKGFSFSVTAYKNDGSTAWDGTLTTAMLSASEDVVLSGVTVSDNTISGTYGVKASATSPVSFFLELPSTDDCAAATLEQERTFTACSGTGGDGETYKVPMKSSYESKATGKPDYRCENEYGYISPEFGASSVSLSGNEYDEFDHYINSGRSSVLVATKVDAVKKIQIYLNANGGAAQVTNVYAAGSYSSALKDYTAMTEKTDYTVSYTDEEGNTSIAKGKNGYIELAFTANLDEGTLIYVVLKKAAKYYGAKLTVGSGSGATVTTTLAWSNSQASGATVVKGEDDADFTITATRSDAAAQASMGEIRYLSSDTKVATVNAVTGQVIIADGIDFGGESSKTTTITAMLLNSGCYKGAKITYTLQVNKSECTDAAGTIEITEDNGCEGVVMTVSGYEEGASIAWYKDGSAITLAATGTTYTATTSGSYTVVTTKTCARTSNSIVVEMETASASKIVDSWYVKNGRRTPDIALVQTTGATSFTVKSGETTIWDEANSNTTGFGGCDFELKEDGIIYLHGTKKNGDAPSDLVAGNETITVTVSGCGGALDGLDIIIKKQAETLKPSVAFVVDGTTRAKGGTATSVSAAKTSERPLWTYLSSSFTLTGCNIYWSVDSKELREYYSQYDAIVVTDDPNTQTTGAGGVEYVKAFGTLVDVRPILTMEAYVGRYTDGGWHVYNATPTSPNPRQVEMKLECKNHEIFAGVSEASDNVRSVTINGDDYWYITIVDTTQSPYKGTTKDYKDLPALQGFDPSSFSDMLGIGTIKEDEFQAGVERQQEPAARMMILGIQNNAMGALTNEGKLIIKNAISYLLKTNMEEVDDCSNYFTGATSTDWTEPTNWSKNSVPDFATKVRILAPVVIENGQKVRASQVDIVVDGTSSKKDGELNGHVTINPGGALVVGGTVNRAIAPHYGIDDLQPTTDEDIFIKADEDNSAALILDNSSGLTGATVQMYSSSFWEPEGSVKKKYWSYVAVPIQEALIPDYFYGAFTYYYVEKDGWDKKWDGDYLYPFQAIGLSRDKPGIEHFWGPLVSTENRDIKLTKTYMGGGENLIANSWTAPIQIANFDADDFGDALATIYIYNTGNKDSYAGSTVIDANTTNQGAFTAGQWLGIPIGVAKLPEYTGLKVIPAMQTFEVDIPGEAPYGTETTLHLDYDRLVRGVDITEDNLTERLHAPKRSMNKNDGDVEAVMKVRVAGVHTLAEVWLIQDGAFGEGFDNGWEAYYAACDDRSPQLYAHSENGNMGIIAKQELEGTILGFAPSRDGADYTFSFYYRGDEELYLNDLLMETSTPITNEDTYAFTASENGDGSRFIISSNPYETPQIITGTEVVKEAQNEKVKKFIYNDKLYILYRGMVFDANGKLINRK